MTPGTDSTLSRHVVVDELRKLCFELGCGGEVLPGEPKLAIMLGVGRATLRDALTRLEAEGLILRRKGADTIVNTAAFEMSARIDLQSDFSEILRDSGFEADMELLGAELAPMSEIAAIALGLEPGTEALRTRKLWTADSRPVMFAEDWVPMFDSIAAPDASRPVFELAAETGGEEIAWELASPGAVVSEGDVSLNLRLEVGRPLWTLERVGIGRSGRRAFFAFEYHVPTIVRYGFIRSLGRP
jgi:GntR family transcriptional regulator